MYDLIRRLAEWLRLLFVPGTGIHRAGSRPTRQSSQARLTAVRHPVPHPVCPSLPVHRSPYGLDLPLDGTGQRLVRPYLTAHEQERALQRRRCIALVLAADFGIDVDRHLVGAGEVAA
ncbi:hypothetical protein [Streptomyces bluensis]|uniref:hypothetical protein n=1 Tax=Streptomyces bluensis TaxID=33897 RepID=UPI00331DA93D